MSGASGGARDPDARAARPPRMLEWLARVVLPAASREAVLGDLHEGFLQRIHARGRAGAIRWYARQSLGFVALIPLVRTAAALALAVRDFFSPSGWLGDFRDAGRAVIRERGLTTAVVAVLGLAVGGATTVFSVVTAVLLRPLPYERPSELAMLWDEYADAAQADPKPVTLLHYRSWRERSDLFTAIGAYESIPTVIDAGRWPERVDAALVSASLFATLGAGPALGRPFSPEDDQTGAPRVVILSHELWQSVFGGDPRVIGRSIDVDGEPTEVIGVMPADFWFYDPYAATRSYTGSSASTARLWRPLAGRFGDEGYPRYRVIGRLRPGLTPQNVAGALAAAEPALPLDPQSADGRVRVVSLDEQVEAGVRPRLLGLSGGVVLVLLIAAVNLVTLLAARFDVRRPELALRAALGAGRGRLVRALMVHGLLLSVAGAGAGCLAARAAIPVLLDLVPRGLPLAHRAGLDAAMMLFALGASVAIGLAVTGLAAARLARDGETAVLASRSRTVAGRYARGRLTSVMTTVQVALSLVLLISATILLRSLVGIHRIDAGFDRRDTLTFQSLLMLSAPGAAPDFPFFDRLETRLTTLPGVTSAGSAAFLPFSRWGSTAAIRIVGPGSPTAPRRIDYRAVSPGYFETLRTTRLAGRSFTAADGSDAPAVAIVNRTFAEEFFGGAESALDTLLRVARGREVERRVIGVVGNVKEGQLFADDRPIVYVPIAQSPTLMRQFVVRSTASPGRLVESIRQLGAEVDRRQPLGNFITLEALVEQSIEEERFYAVVTGSFAAIALLLALSGLYGVVSFAVRQRVREVGVRIALGATPRSVYRLIVSEGMRPVVAGIALGLCGAAAASRLLRALIHGVAEVDPVSYFAATMAFASIAAAACFIPARRAANVDPVRALGDS